MGLETATFISQLIAAWPLASDLESQGANHLQLIKSVLQSTFPTPSMAAGFYFPAVSGFTTTVNLLASHQNRLILCDTSGGTFFVTLPSLVVGNAGWSCSIMKTTFDANPFFIQPPSGVIQSGEVAGLSYARRCIPGHITQVFWTGTSWILTRVPRVPIGTLIDFAVSSPPVGYELPDGGVLNTANYPEYAAVNGGGAKVDARSQVIAAPDNMGTGAKGIWPAAVFAQALGEVSHVLGSGEVPNHSHSFSGTSSGQSNDHTHSMAGGANILVSNPSSVGAGTSFGVSVGGPNTSGTSNDHTHTYSGSTSTFGGSGAHNNVQLTTILNKILVVE